MEGWEEDEEEEAEVLFFLSLVSRNEPDFRQHSGFSKGFSQKQQ